MPAVLKFTVESPEAIKALSEACRLAGEINKAHPTRCSALLVDNLEVAVDGLVSRLRRVKPKEEGMLGSPVRVYSAPQGGAVVADGVCVGKAQMLSGRLMYAVAASVELTGSAATEAAENEARWFDSQCVERVTDKPANPNPT